jgi:hypothetical protein
VNKFAKKVKNPVIHFSIPRGKRRTEKSLYSWTEFCEACEREFAMVETYRKLAVAEKQKRRGLFCGILNKKSNE